MITTSAAKSLQTASSTEVRFPHAARHIPRCSTLHHHSPRLQETNSQCKKAIPGNADSTSSEHSTRIPVIDVGGEPDGHFVLRCSPGGASFHRPLAKRSRTGRDGTGASLASSAEAFWLPCLLSVSAWFSWFENILSQAEALTFQNDYTSRCVRVILAQGPC